MGNHMINEGVVSATENYSKMKKICASNAHKRRDPLITKKRILDIAAQEFAKKGYDGVRLDKIIERSEVSKSLLYHYFKGKKDLFTQVMEHSYASMRFKQDASTPKAESPIEEIRAIIVAMIQHYSEDPTFINLLADENCHEAEHIRQSQAIQSMYAPFRARIRQILRSGQKQGVFRKDIDWVDLYISISGMASYFFSNRYTLSVVLGVDLSKSHRLKSRLRSVPEMVLSYLCADNRQMKLK